jgi:hypothetical protein
MAVEHLRNALARLREQQLALQSLQEVEWRGDPGKTGFYLSKPLFAKERLSPRKRRYKVYQKWGIDKVDQKLMVNLILLDQTSKAGLEKFTKWQTTVANIKKDEDLETEYQRLADFWPYLASSNHDDQPLLVIEHETQKVFVREKVPGYVVAVKIDSRKPKENLKEITAMKFQYYFNRLLEERFESLFENHPPNICLELNDHGELIVRGQTFIASPPVSSSLRT